MRLFVIVALCVSIGAHWFVLQSIAWTTMILQYSRSISLVQAVEQTFDGHHPCNLCKGITAASHSEQKNDTAQPVTKKADLICVSRSSGLLPPHSDFRFITFSVDPPLRIDSPLTPPPRPELA